MDVSDMLELAPVSFQELTVNLSGIFANWLLCIDITKNCILKRIIK